MKQAAAKKINFYVQVPINMLHGIVHVEDHLCIRYFVIYFSTQDSTENMVFLNLKSYKDDFKKC